MTTKLAIAIDLDQLRQLMAEFCSEVAGGGGPMDMERRMHLSTFLTWLRQKRQETSNETKQNYT
jgi:hypothetical protein